MRQKLNIIILSIDHWLDGLVYSAASLSQPGCEVFWVDPGESETELAALKLLAERLPLALEDATGDPRFGRDLHRAPELAPLVESGDMPAVIEAKLLRERFGPLHGLVSASREDPARCLKAAVLAVRLGYCFLPLERLIGTPPLPEGLPLICLGQESRHGGLENAGFKKITFIPDDTALAGLLQQTGPAPDYLLLYNSDDILARPVPSRSMGDFRVRGLSLLAPLCASYRPVMPYDVSAAQPDARAIERDLNRFVSAAGLRPKYQAILASPGAVPFIYDRRLTIGSRSEEAVREIHLQLNGDLFFDLAEGRLFQSTPGGLSGQLISTKHFHRLGGGGAAGKDGKEVLVVMTPHVEGGIIFTSDEAQIEAQLKPLLEKAGHRVSTLAGEEAHHAAIATALSRSDFFLYSGHGGQESLHAHGRFLSRRELPGLPPLIAFATACSTAAVDPHHYSTSDGLDWEHIPVQARDVFGLAMVEQGALCYVGGTTIEDLQYSTSIFGIFMEALLIKGCSVGEAVRRMRHFISIYASMLQQKSPQGYACYKQGMANTIHQQLLLGDPALVPSPRPASGDMALPQETEMDGDHCRLRVAIPDDRWRRVRKAVSPLPPSKYYYRSRSIEVLAPVAGDVVSWGDYYRIAPDAGGISETALMSGYLHLHLDLPPGRWPVRLNLVEVRAAGSECLLCGKEVRAPAALKEAFQDFRIPYLLLPPSRLDMTSGWAFALEERGPEEGPRIHWLVPALVIDEAAQAAVRASEFLFEVETWAEQEVTGTIAAPGDSETGSGGSCLISAAAAPAAGPAGAGGSSLATAPEMPLNIVSQALSRPGGSFELTCTAAANVLLISEQYPLYELPELCRGFQKERLALPLQGPEIHLRRAAAGKVRGKALDSRSGALLPGVLLRVWRGIEDPVGDPLIECFAGEAISDAGGAFAFDLPAGKYILSAVGRHDGVQYKSTSLNIELFAGEEQHLLLPLDAAAVVAGSLKFRGLPPPHPVIACVMSFPEKEGGRILVSTPVRPDGTYSCLVSFQDRFYVWIEEEGWQPIRDDNGGRGYRVSPGDRITLDYTLVPDES